MIEVSKRTLPFCPERRAGVRVQPASPGTRKDSRTSRRQARRASKNWSRRGNPSRLKHLAVWRMRPTPTWLKFTPDRCRKTTCLPNTWKEIRKPWRGLSVCRVPTPGDALRGAQEVAASVRRRQSERLRHTRPAKPNLHSRRQILHPCGLPISASTHPTPPNRPDGTVHKTKAEAGAVEHC